MNNAADMLKLIELEQIEHNIFRGTSEEVFGPRVFGGQVLGQALRAAIETVAPDRNVHSLHGYFILPGDVNRPIIYQVERLRDGGSFTTRRITAVQAGRAIFNMSASFQVSQGDSLEHQISMPDVPAPESLLSSRDLAKQHRDRFPKRYAREMQPHPVEFRPVETPDWLEPGNRSPQRHVWIRARGDMPNDPVAHQTGLAFMSDYYLLSTAVQPHRGLYDYTDLQMASLDHAMWFHRDFRANDWLLYALDSPSASNTRGFNRGDLFTRDGRLVASVVQEGLIRKRRKL